VTVKFRALSRFSEGMLRRLAEPVDMPARLVALSATPHPNPLPAQRGEGMSRRPSPTPSHRAAARESSAPLTSSPHSVGEGLFGSPHPLPQSWMRGCLDTPYQAVSRTARRRKVWLPLTIALPRCGRGKSSGTPIRLVRPVPSRQQPTGCRAVCASLDAEQRGRHPLPE
jgi:hypothetical protein